MEANNNVSVGAKEIEILKEHFPACFHNGSFDIERLKEYLKDKVNVTEEGYELRFLGKNYARLLASLDTTTVIVPDEEHNDLPENKDSKNIYISGDNLDALKHLLKSYAGSIKCIYIDPPYNTGSDDFVYADSFNFTVEELASKLSISEEQASRVLDLTRRGSATHSAWLMFMLPRLLLARDLLSKDGVIFISIDDNEVHNLRLLMNEIFGEENFIACFKWNRVAKAPSLSDTVRTKYEYVLSFCKSTRPILYGKDSYNTQGPLWHLPNKRALLNFPEKSIRIPQSFKAGDYGGTYQVELLDDMIEQDGLNAHSVRIKACSSWGQAKIDSYIESGHTFQIKKSPVTMYTDLTNENNFIAPSDLIDNDECGVKRNTDAQEELKKLDIPFDYPKPVSLPQYLIKTITYNDSDAVILDFFAGSGTTAHAVMQLNREYGGNRKYILIQLQEQCKEDSEAYKFGYKTIDEIGMERIKRAAKQIRENTSLFNSDLGFKHYTLLEPSSGSLEKMEQFDPHSIFGDKTLVDEFGVPTILTTWLVRDGYGLTPDVQTLKIDGYDVYYIDKHLYITNPNLKNEVVAALLDKYQTDADFNPQNIVVYGYALSWSELQGLKDNLRIIHDGEKNMRINFDIRY